MTEADAGSNAANPSDASAWVAGREDSLEGAYFHTDDGHWFEPTAHCRGPWDVDGCHAGPPSGLLARSMERAIDASLRSAGNHQRLVRLTVDLIRPIPMAGFRVEAEVVRAGRSVSTLRAVIRDGDGRERVTATGLALRNDRNHPLPTIDERLYHPEEADPGGFPLTRAMHDQPGFVGSVALRYPPGETTAPGPTAVWMKTVPLIEGEAPSPFQRICPLADCGNAFSRNAEPWDVGFVNPDLTIVLHRPPDGEWLGSSSASYWQPDGTGLAQAELFDRHGPVGMALQTLLLSPRD